MSTLCYMILLLSIVGFTVAAFRRLLRWDPLDFLSLEELDGIKSMEMDWRDVPKRTAISSRQTKPTRRRPHAPAGALKHDRESILVYTKRRCET